MMEWIMNVPSNVIFVRGNHGEEFAAAIDIMKSICKFVWRMRRYFMSALFMFDSMAEATQDSKTRLLVYILC